MFLKKIKTALPPIFCILFLSVTVVTGRLPFFTKDNITDVDILILNALLLLYLASCVLGTLHVILLLAASKKT